MAQPSERLVKKPYQPPKLHVYGDLAEMTKALGKKGSRDGGVRPQKRNTGQ
jgi:hypothetical protein